MTVFSIVCLTLLQVNDPANDLKKMEGKWRLVSVEFAGKKHDVPNRDAIDLEVTDDRLIRYQGPLTRRSDVIKFDSTSNLKILDVVFKPEKGDPTFKSGEQTVLGIYKLEGEVLTLCTVSRADRRPTAFTAGEDDRSIIQTYKRIKAN